MEELHRKKEKTLRATWLISLWAPLGTGVALYFGQTTVLLADFLRRNTELLGLFLAWLAYRRVMKGPDQNYPYGAHKMEDMASLAVGIIMVVSGLIISYSAVPRFFSPDIPGWLVPGLVVSGCGMVVNGWFWFRFRSLNKKETTPIVTAHGGLYRAKTLIDTVVFVTLILTGLGLGWSVYIDPSGSMVIAIFLIYSGINISLKSGKNLLDRVPDEIPLQELKKDLEKFYPVKDLKARSASNRVIIEATLALPGDKTVARAEEEIREIKELFSRKWPRVDISIYPAENSPPG